MKRLLYLALLVVSVTISTFAHGQTSQQANDSVFVLIRRHFNNKDTDALYALTGEKFHAQISRSTFGNVAAFLFPMGPIEQAELEKYNGGVSTYRLHMAGAKMKLHFSLDDKHKLAMFLFKPWQAGKPVQEPTSNRLISVVDRQVDTAARRYIQSEGTVGLAIGVWKDGKMSTYGYGATAKGGSLPDDRSVFEIGSVTKTFTATLLAYYAQQKKLDVSDPIIRYLPDSVAANKALAGITLLMLTNHTSGLPSLPDNFVLHMPDTLNPYKYYTVQHLFSALTTCKPLTPPGSKYSYSNMALGLLGVILERVSGKSYDRMVKDIITGPLGMESTAQNMDEGMRSRFVTVHDETGNVVPAWDFDAIAGAGALRSTVHDLLLYARAQLHPSAGALGAAIAQAHRITATFNMPVAMGWHGATISGVRLLWHNGGTYGSSSYVAFVPGGDIAVVVLANSGQSVDEVATAIVKGLL